MCSVAAERPWTPLVSLVMPCRNEADGIEGALNSLLEQDYPARLTEVIVVDGMSSDGTAAVVEKVARENPGRSIRLVANPRRITPAALNLGIAAARGDVVFTLGAHTRYSVNYVSGAVATMKSLSADAVGSVAVTLPGDRVGLRPSRLPDSGARGGSAAARAVAAALSSRFGVGGSLMRVGVRQPTRADTASCPGYRRSVFERVGLFHEGLVRNQDIEFNLRLRRAGLCLVVDPGIRSYYTARPTIAGMCRNAFANGYWVVNGLRFTRLGFAPRHLAPACATLTGVALAALTPWTGVAAKLLAAFVGVYAALDAWFALRARPTAMIPERGNPPITIHHSPSAFHSSLFTLLRVSLHSQLATRLLLLATFPLLHLSYGLGSLRAAAGLATSPRSRREIRNSKLEIRDWGEARGF